MQVTNISTPANYFHALRRQIHRNFRKPLIIMSPKSLLRHPRCVSRLDELGPGTSFHRVLWDDAQWVPDKFETKLAADKKIKRVILCSGKVYYDLLEEREKLGRGDVYLLRLEQFYPYPDDALQEELSRFKQAEMVWCQEEPKNMGGWQFVQDRLEETLLAVGAKHSRPRYLGRAASASTATGIKEKHEREQQAILDGAFA